MEQKEIYVVTSWIWKHGEDDSNDNTKILGAFESEKDAKKFKEKVYRDHQLECLRRLEENENEGDEEDFVCTVTKLLVKPASIEIRTYKKSKREQDVDD